MLKKWMLGALALFLASVLYVFFLAVKKHETWIMPEISGQVMVAGDDGGGLAGATVVAWQREVGSVATVTDELGRFSFDATKVTKRRFPGDPCYWTYVSSGSDRFDTVTAEVGICGGEVDGDDPPPEFFVEFTLAPNGSSLPSRAEVELLHR